jgi:MFS family permease
VLRATPRPKIPVALAVWGSTGAVAGAVGLTLGAALVAPFMGRLAARIGQQPLLLAGGVLYALGAVWRLVALDGQADYVGAYLPSMVFTGLGVVGAGDRRVGHVRAVAPVAHTTGAGSCDAARDSIGCERERAGRYGDGWTHCSRGHPRWRRLSPDQEA